MIRIARLFTALLLAAACAYASAHSTEPVVKGPLTPKKAYALAERMVDSLIHAQMLGPSWKKRKFGETKMRVADDDKLWVVRYTNAKEADQSKKTLYVFFDDNGKYLDSNHDGKLRGTEP